MFREHEGGGEARQSAAYDQMVEITFLGCLHFFSSKITKAIFNFNKHDINYIVNLFFSSFFPANFKQKAIFHERKPIFDIFPPFPSR